MTVRLLAVLEDGSELDEEIPNYQLGDLEIQVQETEETLFVRIEIEDSNGKLIYQYKRKATYAY
jgi:hypothetical protein